MNRRPSTTTRWRVVAIGVALALGGCGAFVYEFGPCRDRNAVIGIGGALVFLGGGLVVLKGFRLFS